MRQIAWMSSRQQWVITSAVADFPNVLMYQSWNASPSWMTMIRWNFKWPLNHPTYLGNVSNVLSCKWCWFSPRVFRLVSKPFINRPKSRVAKTGQMHWIGVAHNCNHHGFEIASRLTGLCSYYFVLFDEGFRRIDLWVQPLLLSNRIRLTYPVFFKWKQMEVLRWWFLKGGFDDFDERTVKQTRHFVFRGSINRRVLDVVGRDGNWYWGFNPAILGRKRWFWIFCVMIEAFRFTWGAKSSEVFLWKIRL